MMMMVISLQQQTKFVLTNQSFYPDLGRNYSRYKCLFTQATLLLEKNKNKWNTELNF